jgi:hypothetical protein
MMADETPAITDVSEMAQELLAACGGAEPTSVRNTTRPKRVWMPPANPGTRARAPLPSLRPLQVLLVYGGHSMCYYI